MPISIEGLAQNYTYIAHEYYALEHETCRNFEHATEKFFQSKLVDLCIPVGGTMLDMGSGGGLSRRYLGKQSSDRCVELDMNAAMLKQSECGMKVCADALALPFADNSFDKVTAFLFDPFNQTPLENEIYRVLKSGGMFLGTLPSWDWASTLRYIEDINVHQTRFRLTGTNVDIFVPSHVSQPESIKSRFVSAGFAEPQVMPIYPDVTRPVSRHIQSAARLLGKMSADLEIVTCVKAIKL